MRVSTCLFFFVLANAKVSFGPFLRQPGALPGCWTLSVVLRCHCMVSAIWGGGRGKGKGQPYESRLQIRYGKEEGVYLCLAFRVCINALLLLVPPGAQVCRDRL